MKTSWLSSRSQGHKYVREFPTDKITSFCDITLKKDLIGL